MNLISMGLGQYALLNYGMARQTSGACVSRIRESLIFSYLCHLPCRWTITEMGQIDFLMAKFPCKWWFCNAAPQSFTRCMLFLRNLLAGSTWAKARSLLTPNLLWHHWGPARAPKIYIMLFSATGYRQNWSQDVKGFLCPLKNLSSL